MIYNRDRFILYYVLIVFMSNTSNISNCLVVPSKKAYYVDIPKNLIVYGCLGAVCVFTPVAWKYLDL